MFGTPTTAVRAEKCVFFLLAFMVLVSSATFTTDPLRVLQVNEQAVSVTWTPAVDPVDSYNVLARESGSPGPFQQIFATRDSTALIKGISPTKEFEYVVEVDGQMTPTTARALEAPAHPLPNPVSLPPAPVVTELSSTAVFLTWTAFGEAPYIVEAFFENQWRPIYADGDTGGAPRLYGVVRAELPGVPLPYRVTSPTRDISTPATTFATSAAANDFGFDPAKGALKLTTIAPELVLAYSDTNTGSIDPSTFDLSLSNNAQALVRYNLNDPALDLCSVIYARLVFPSVTVASGRLDGGFFRVYSDLDRQWDALTPPEERPLPSDPNYFVSDAQALEGTDAEVAINVNLDIILPGTSGAVPTIQRWIDGAENRGLLLTYQTSLSTVLEVEAPVLEFASFTSVASSLGVSGLDVNTFSTVSTCEVCDGPATCSSDIDFGSLVSSFDDNGQIPAGAVLLSMEVRVRGTWDSTIDSRFSVAVAGTLVQEKFVSGTDLQCGDTICDVELFTSPRFSPQVGGWPNYNYGGQNSIEVMFDGPEICIHEISFLFFYIENDVVDPNCAPTSATPTPTITPSRTPSRAPSPSASPTPLRPSSLPSASRSPVPSAVIVGPSQSPSPVPSATQAPSTSTLSQVPTPSPFPSPSRSPLGCVGVNNGSPQCQPAPTIAPLPQDDGDTVVEVTDPAGEPIGTVTIPVDSVPPGSDVVIMPVNVLPDVSPNLSIPVDITIFRNGVEVPLEGEIEICLDVEGGNIEDSCLGFINDDGEWECQDNCLRERGGQLCGTTDHLTSFAVLFSGGAADGCEDSSDQFIFDALWKDLLMMSLVAAFIICYLFVICVLLIVVPGGSRLVYGKEGSRIRTIRNQGIGSRLDEISFLEEQAGGSGSDSGGVVVEEL